MHDDQSATVPKQPPDKYIVYVDDNFHFMDESERYKLGEFDTEAEAIRAAQRIVNDFLETAYKPGMAADTLLNNYRAFGEDPWISPGKFSAWSYAERRCRELTCQ